MNTNFTKDDGTPDGGISTGIGYTIGWQRGPCPLNEAGEQPDRNGAFLIEVLESCEARLQAYQDGPFACDENAEALFDLDKAITSLRGRLLRRKDAGKLGTHKKD